MSYKPSFPHNMRHVVIAVVVHQHQHHQRMSRLGQKKAETVGSLLCKAHREAGPKGVENLQILTLPLLCH